MRSISCWILHHYKQWHQISLLQHMDGEGHVESRDWWMRIEHKKLFGCSHIQIVWCIENITFHFTNNWTYRHKKRTTTTKKKKEEIFRSECCRFFGRKKWLPLCFLIQGLHSKDHPSFIHCRPWLLPVSFFNLKHLFHYFISSHWRKSHYFPFLPSKNWTGFWFNLSPFRLDYPFSPMELSLS